MMGLNSHSCLDVLVGKYVLLVICVAVCFALCPFRTRLGRYFRSKKSRQSAGSVEVLWL